MKNKLYLAILLLAVFARPQRSDSPQAQLVRPNDRMPVLADGPGRPPSCVPGEPACPNNLRVDHWRAGSIATERVRAS